MAGGKREEGERRGKIERKYADMLLWKVGLGTRTRSEAGVKVVPTSARQEHRFSDPRT